MILAERYRGKVSASREYEVQCAAYSEPIRVTGLGYFRNLGTVLHTLHPSAIIVNLYYSLPALQAYWFARKEGVPLYISAEEDGYRNIGQRIFFPLWDMTMGKAILSYATAVLCWSKGTCLFMERIADKEKIVYFPASIDVQECGLPQIKNSKKEEGVRLILPARLVPVKNHALLLKALTIVRDKYRVPFHLALLGDGPLRSTIEELVAEYKLEQSVEMCGNVSREEVLSSYGEYDALVLPGRHETIGFVVLEAMAHGIPAIVSDTLGARDFIEDGISGLLFQSGNAEDLAEKIATMARVDTRRMGVQARLRVEQRFDTQKQSQTLYETLLGKGGGIIFSKK